MVPSLRGHVFNCQVRSRMHTKMAVHDNVHHDGLVGRNTGNLAVAHDRLGWTNCLHFGRTGVYDWRLHLYKRRTESNTGQVWISRDLARSCDMWGCVSLCSNVFLCAAVGRVIGCWFIFGESDGAMILICYKSSAALLVYSSVV